MASKNHTQQADTSTDKSLSRQQRPPTVITTGTGYQYVRSRYDGADNTVYIHQLCAIASGADPYEVFSDRYDTHHLPLSDVFDLDEHVPPAPIYVSGESIPPIDTPESVELQPQWEHRTANLQGGQQ